MPRRIVNLRGEALYDMPHAAYPAACRVRNYAEWFSQRISHALISANGGVRSLSCIRHSPGPQRAFRKLSSRSSGRNRPGFTFRGVVLASAASFKARWACK
jgi:hypothetical protein